MNRIELQLQKHSSVTASVADNQGGNLDSITGQVSDF